MVREWRDIREEIGWVLNWGDDLKIEEEEDGEEGEERVKLKALSNKN